MADDKSGQGVETAWRESVLLLLAHGSESTASGADTARRHADALKSRGLFADVKAAFLRDTPHPRDVIAAETERDIYVVPFMASDGYTIDTLIPEALGLAGSLTERIVDGARQRVHVCRPVGTHASLLDWSVGRLARFAAGLAVDEQPASVLICAHGTDRHAGNFDRARDVVDAVERLGIATCVDAVFLDQSPRVDSWRDRVATKTVLVLPYLMSIGRHGRHDIPETLGFAGQGASAILAEQGIAGPFESGEHTIYYGPLLGACPAIPDVAIERVRQWDLPADEPEA